MKKVCQKIGNHPVYLSFDIDSLDPAFAPGTGTAEIGGLTIYQALEIIRGCFESHWCGFSGSIPTF